MRYFFPAHPSVRLLACAVGGILVGVWLPVVPLAWFSVAFSVCIAALLMLFFDRKRLPGGKLSPWSVFTYLLLVCTAFAFHASAAFRLVPVPSLLSWVGRDVIVSGFIDGRPVDGEGLTTMHVQVVELFEAGRRTKLDDRAKVVVRWTDNRNPEFEEGEFVRVKGRLAVLPVAANRGEYDPRYQSRLKGIHVQLFCAGPWMVLREAPKPGFSLYPTLVTPLRRYLANALDRHMPAGGERQFVKGMILGERDILSDELYDAFRRTGTAHVLAVSGLHVLLLAYVINLCLQRLKTTPTGRWLSLLIFVAVISLYSFVTGNAPSIKRAAVMSVMMVAGSTLGRKSWPVNSLAASDLLILLFDPFDLFNPGFQMTNGAVLGILVLYQPFSAMVPNSKKVVPRLLHLLWSAFSVSIVAIIGVSPVIAFWFGTFSVAGIVANLPVVLFSNLAMYAALPLFFVAGFSGWTASVFGACTWLFARLTILFTAFFSHLSFASVAIRPDMFDVVVFYLISAFAFHAFFRREWGRGVVCVLVGMNLLLWHDLFRPLPKAPGVVTVNMGRDIALLFSSGSESCLIDAGRRTGSQERLDRQVAEWGLSVPVIAAGFVSRDSVLQSLPVPVMSHETVHTVKRSFVVRRLEEKVLRIDSKARSLLLVSGLQRLEEQQADGADVVFWIWRFTGKEWARLDAWITRARPHRMLLVPGSFITPAQQELLQRFARSHPDIEVRSRNRQTVWW